MKDLYFFNAKLNKELRKFLKKESFNQEKSMNTIIIEAIEFYKKNKEKNK